VGKTVKEVRAMHTKEATMPLSTSGTALKYLGMRCYQLAMEGRFDPGWICGLTYGLSQRRINITRVEAARGTGRNWQSRLDLDFSFAELPPDAIDYLALSKPSATVQALAEPVVLDDYQLERSTKCGSSLYLEASGPDRIGVLSSLLNTFSLFSLFPAEMLVETKGKRIFDRFWLKGMGDSAPSNEAVVALRERMREFADC
jgi:hypothetical protein